MVCQPWGVRRWILQFGVESSANDPVAFMISQIERWKKAWKSENPGRFSNGGLWNCVICGAKTYIQWDCCRMCGSLKNKTYGRFERF